VGNAFTTPEGERRVITVMRDVSDRRVLEEQLRHSQKMEAVGRLAGGLAHDFNNLLTIIAGCADLLEPNVQGDPAAAETRARIVEATQRAGAVTRQLLTIARGRVVETEVLELNEVVAQIEPLVRRSLGEDVELSLRLAAEAGRVRSQRSQIEQVILNLAINARDAMPQGGRLEITTGRVSGRAARRVGLEEGDYALLRVRDDGLGMSAETRARALDPFFTTKPPGRGSGLGLSVVFGIARQAGGTIHLESAPGAGTTASIFLASTGDRVPPCRASALGPSRGGGERLLLLEDDASVREVCREGLKRLGYAVDAVADPDEARRLLAGGEAPIRLLITDLVARRGGNAELLAELAVSRPELPVLLISGHGGEAAPPLLERRARLEKPFSLASLGRAVRELIDAG
jgi:hypothetical protein